LQKIGESTKQFLKKQRKQKKTFNLHIQTHFVLKVIQTCKR